MPPSHRPRTLLPVGLYFFFSGLTGLVYQVVWFRMLARAFGVTVYAITTVLVVFMAGLAIGSFGASRLSGARASLRVYGFLELLIGASAALSSYAMTKIPVLLAGTDALVAHALLGHLVRGALSLAVLLPPTVLMGATLPVLSAFVAEQHDTLERGAGLLYGANTLGAVFGVVLAGFVLIAALGESRTVAAGVAVNCCIAAMALATRHIPTDIAERTTNPPAQHPGLRKRVLVASLLSGVAALAYEVIWFRVLTVILGSSVYAFSCMLAAYLTGIGVGSLVMSRSVTRLIRPIFVFAFLEVAVSLLALSSLRVFATLGLHGASSAISAASDIGFLLVKALFVVLPATLCLGATFPVAARLVSSDGEPAERSVGRLYGYNTVGSIAGSLVAGAILIPTFGTQVTFLAMTGLSLVLGLYLLSESAKREHARHALLTGAVASSLFALLAFVSREDPFVAVLVRQMGPSAGALVVSEDDAGATISMFETARHRRTLFINGLYVSNTTQGAGEDMINVPLAFDPEPGNKRILAVGLGVGEALRYGVDAGHDVTVVELHRKVIDIFERFNADHERYLAGPTGRVVLGDGRNYLLHSKERFDLILVDGSPPLYASGMVNLYAAEFTRLARDHLSPAGVFAIWFPVVCFEDDFWMTVRNFADTFPNIGVYTNPGTPNAVLLGSSGPPGQFEIDPPVLARRLARSPLHPYGSLGSIVDALRLSRTELRDNALRYAPVTDDRPATEFPLFHFLKGDRYYSDNRFLFPSWFPAGTHRCAPKNAADCQRQCDEGQIDSCLFDGALAFEGKGVPRDDERAFKAFKRACYGGLVAACNDLGGMIQRGHGTTADEVLAATLFRRACDAGVPAACHNLALAYRSGRGVDPDDGKVASLFRRACQEELPEACIELRRLDTEGAVPPEELAVAREAEERACRAGIVPACAP